MDIIKTDHLTKYYGKSRGITDLSLTVGKGEFFGFIGPNGAGKSTTIRILLGLIRADSGSASVFGMDTVCDRRNILENIGYIPSEAMFYHNTTVAEILRLSASLRRKDCTAQAQDLCERLQLDPRQKTDSLSLGNRKKVAIVCALQHSPALCVFDEPTSGLDPLIQKELPDIYGTILSAAIVFSVVSPLLWGIITRKNHSAEFRKLWNDNRFNRGALVSLVLIKILVCVVILMSLVVRLFNVASGAALLVAAAIIISFYYSKRLRKHSALIEERFSQNFQGQEETQEQTDTMKSLLEGAEQLANLHTADFTVAAESCDAGSQLKEIAPRSRYRVNIVSIARGDRRIDLPEGSERIYPFDKITAVGTDEDLRLFGQELDTRLQPDRNTGKGPRMSIRNIPLESSSPVINKRLREIKVRSFIVLALERDRQITMNPGPDTMFQPGDIVWIVGKKGAEQELV